jgi:hypothetical protein
MYDNHFEDMEDFMKLLSGCPILEDVENYICSSKCGVTTGGYFKPVSILINAEVRSFKVPFRSVYNVKLLTIFEVCMNDI